MFKLWMSGFLPDDFAGSDPDSNCCHHLTHILFIFQKLQLNLKNPLLGLSSKFPDTCFSRVNLLLLQNQLGEGSLSHYGPTYSRCMTLAQGQIAIGPVPPLPPIFAAPSNPPPPHFSNSSHTLFTHIHTYSLNFLFLPPPLTPPPLCSPFPHFFPSPIPFSSFHLHPIPLPLLSSLHASPSLHPFSIIRSSYAQHAM
jgi:hypothetical protein